MTEETSQPGAPPGPRPERRQPCLALLLVGGLGFVAGGVAQHTRLLPVMGRGGAHGAFTARADPAGSGRDVEVVTDGLDLVVRLDGALEVHVRDGARAARLVPAEQRVNDVAAFAYLEVSVDAGWAFVFGHAIRTVERGARYELDGVPVPAPAAGKPTILHLAPR